MKKLFGQKPKILKASSQASPIPTPVPAEEFTRTASKAPADDHWVVVQDQGHAPFHQDRSRSSSFASLPPGVATYATNPGSNNSMYQYPVHQNPYDSSAQHSSQSLIPPSQNQASKKRQQQPLHGTTAILRSLDPEQSNIGRSSLPSPENLVHTLSIESLPLSVETERDPRSMERDYDVDKGQDIQQRDQGRQQEKHRDKDLHKERGKERGREDRVRERNLEDRGKDRDKPREKEKKKGLFGAGKDKDKEKDKESQAELTRMIGYLTATASEDWSLVLEVCERASANETAARDAARALRREFKYAEPGAQLSAARIWAIMLRNCSHVFIAQASNKKFLETLEEVLLASSTSPVVRERLLDVLAAAAFMHPGHGKDGYRSLWKKVKPPNKPDQGIPFDEDDAMLNPSPVPLPNQFSTRSVSHTHVSTRQRVISADEDMRRLFEECEIGRGNAQLLNEALTFARPDELNGPVISEWYRKCRNSQDFIMAQIPWATAQADRSRAEMRRLYSDDHGQETQQVPTSKEEELLAALLGANQELLEAFRIYDDLERLGVAEREEREVQERSRKETKLDRTQIQFIGADGSFQMEETGGNNHTSGSAGPSRSPSPSPAHSYSKLPPVPSQRPAIHSVSPHASTPHSHTSSPHIGLAPPPPAPQGPRQARQRSRTPSPEPPALPPALVPQHSHSGSLGVDIKRLARLSFESVQDLLERASDGGEQTPIVPSAKAIGKRKIDDSTTLDDPSRSDDMLDGRSSLFGATDESNGIDDERSYIPEPHWKKPITFAYDAAAERAREQRRDLGLSSPITNGRAY